MLRWGIQETTASMSPDEGEKVFCFVLLGFSHRQTRQSSLILVWVAIKNIMITPPRTETINANSRRGQKVNCENKKSEGIMTIQKTNKKKTVLAWQQFVRKNSLLGISCEFEYKQQSWHLWVGER